MRTLDAEVTDSRATKRRRKIRSCYNCRKRKLHCDQVAPACGRCVKAGQAADCLYLEDDPASQPSQLDTRNATSTNEPPPSQPQSANRTTPDHDPQSKLRTQEKRITNLETSLEQMREALLQSETLRNRSSRSYVLATPPEATPNASPHAIEPHHKPARYQESILLKGKSFKTRFFGPTYAETAVAYIPEMTILSKDILKTHPILGKLRQDLSAFHRERIAPVSTETDLVSLLPDKADADELVRLYLDHYESVYHIIHVPTFQNEYEKMWSEPLGQARPHFVALVVLMTATARCVRARDPWLYIANSSAERELALAAANVCETWVDTQSMKKVTITDFQVRFLINLVRIVNGSRFKRTWTATGELLRICMAAGLHIDMAPLANSGSTTLLDQEMRRRIWYAVVELELQASLSRGMISTPWPQQSDCSLPLNINDEDSSEDGPSVPRPHSEFTTASYLSVASETVVLRHSLNTAFNDARQTISFEDAGRYTEQIRTCLQEIHQWDSKDSAVPHALLSITLRQYLLILHSYRYRTSNDQSEKDYSGMQVIENARKIVNTHKQLSKSDRYAVQSLCPVLVQAVLAMSYLITAADPRAESAVSDYTSQIASEIVSDAVKMMVEKVYRLGNGQQELWVVLVANALLKIKRDPDGRSSYMQEAAEGMSRPYGKILACQSSASLTGTSIDGILDQPSEVLQQMPGSTAVDWPASLAADQSAVWNFEDWPFDDWTFDHIQV